MSVSPAGAPAQPDVRRAPVSERRHWHTLHPPIRRSRLRKYKLTSRHDPVVIQSFEVSNLIRLNWMTRVRLVQLIDCDGGPYDAAAAGVPLTYAQMSTAKGLKVIRAYAEQVSFCKDVMIPRNPDGSLGTPTSVIRDAHRAHLTVVGWTFRGELLPPARVPQQHQSGRGRRSGRGDPCLP